MSEVKVLVVGCGSMGSSHARAYARIPPFRICGLVSRGPSSRERLAAELGLSVPLFSDAAEAIRALRPDAVSIATWPDSHASLALAALEAGAHVFLEKPLATTLRDAQRVVTTARRCRRALVVGYILRHHPAWIRFIEIARSLGTPLVMRMNLNQQSAGNGWQGHRRLLESASPLVDCGVHYVDVMCAMTGSRPVSVHAEGVRLSDEIAPGQYNWGQLQVRFADGSAGWYEAGWGPMISETAFFVKDVVGPTGCVSIANRTARGSADIEGHTAAETLLRHSARLAADGRFAEPDTVEDIGQEVGHDELCEREQRAFLEAIRGTRDLAEHHRGCLDSLRIVLAADRSIRAGKTVRL